MLRVTPQRQAILALINRSNIHWDAEELARELVQSGQAVGIATVYRGLSALEGAGLIASVQLGDRKRYERIDKSHHDHLVCTECGSLEEFVQPEIERLQAQVAEEKGFRMVNHQLLLFGICYACDNHDSNQDLDKGKKI